MLSLWFMNFTRKTQSIDNGLDKCGGINHYLWQWNLRESQPLNNPEIDRQTERHYCWLLTWQCEAKDSLMVDRECGTKWNASVESNRCHHSIAGGNEEVGAAAAFHRQQLLMGTCIKVHQSFIIALNCPWNDGWRELNEVEVLLQVHVHRCCCISPHSFVTGRPCN